jgi:hypothetical protein
MSAVSCTKSNNPQNNIDFWDYKPKKHDDFWDIMYPENESKS